MKQVLETLCIITPILENMFRNGQFARLPAYFGKLIGLGRPNVDNCLSFNHSGLF
jgi:hypothetical protein